MAKYYEKLVNFWQKLSAIVGNIFFPMKCVCCGTYGKWLCGQCFSKIKNVPENSCLVCKNFSVSGMTHRKCRDKMTLDGIIIACSLNNKLLERAIFCFKYNFVRELGDDLAQILINKLLIDNQARDFLANNNFVVMPMPIHKRRLRWRGFNQTELLACRVSAFLNLRLESNWVIRKKNTKPQVKLKREKRIKNMEGAFAVNNDCQGDLRGINVLVIDDVTTTGSSLNECAKALKENGVAKVWGLVLARG